MDAIFALGEIGDTRAVEPLLPFLTATGGRVVFALEKLRDPRAVPALVALMCKEAHLPAGLGPVRIRWEEGIRLQ